MCRFPERGVSPVIIHFHGIFHEINPPAIGVPPWLWKPPCVDKCPLCCTPYGSHWILEPRTTSGAPNVMLHPYVSGTRFSYFFIHWVEKLPIKTPCNSMHCLEFCWIRRVVCSSYLSWQVWSCLSLRNQPHLPGEFARDFQQIVELCQAVQRSNKICLDLTPWQSNTPIENHHVWWVYQHISTINGHVQ